MIFNFYFEIRYISFSLALKFSIGYLFLGYPEKLKLC
jgi:hypothetical protein